MDQKRWVIISNYFNIFDKKLIDKFIIEARAHGCSESTVKWYLDKLKNVRNKFLRKNFLEWSRDDIKELIAKINQQDYSGWTKYGYKSAIRKFFQIIKGFDWNSKKYPEEVDWIKLEPGKIKVNYNILSKEDIGRMIAFAKTLRNKAFIGLLWSSGCRLSEIANLKINDIHWDQHGCVIFVNGKTGFRPIRIVEYSSYLELYLKHREHESEWVWLTEDNFSKGHKMSIKAIRKMLKRVGKEAGITKPVNPHNFRHSIATEYSKSLTDQQMRIFFGWNKNSKMPSLYSHLSVRDIDKAILKLNGII